MAVEAFYLLQMDHRSVTRLAEAVFPWIEPVYEITGLPYGESVLHSPAILGLFGRSILSVLIVGSSLVLLELLWRYLQSIRGNTQPETQGMFWIMGPYALAYMAAVTGRAMFAVIQDRYLLILAAIVAVWMVRLYEQRIGPKLPIASVALMVFVALFSIAANGTRYSEQRALIRLDQRWRASGMPRREIAEGFPMDLSEQISDGGHINDPHFEHMAGAYDPSVQPWDIPENCGRFYETLFSKVRPKYFVEGREDAACYTETAFPPEPYTAWLPPFRREFLVLRRASHPSTSKSK
jgi:hypothetical protein